MILRTRDIIEQIRRGNVPDGYKKTKTGILPADWDVHMLGDCLSRVEKPVEVKPNELYTQIGIRSHGKGLFYKEPVTGAALGNKAVFWIEPDCFIVNIVFAWEQAIGKTTQSEVGMIGSHRFPMYRPVNDRVDIDYLISYFLTKRGTDILEAASPGGAGRNKTLGQDRFLKSKIVLPPIEDQQKIAAILTTQDRVIELKEKRLAEKQRQKKYLMQQLLTGKKRLPGFSGEWKSVIMGEIGATFSGLSSKSKEDFGQGKPYIPYINIYSNSIIDTQKLEYVRISDEERQEKVKYGDIFFTTSSETPDEVGMSSVLLSGVDEVYLNSFCFGFRLYDFSVLLPVFAAQYFRGDAFRSIIKVLAQGATRYNLSKNNLLKCRLSLPSIREQTAIAEILSAADREIDLLRQDIEQEKQKKKALMQLLLTGIVRVNA